MSAKKKIHFEISERKVLLRVFDVASVMITLYLVGIVFNFNYFIIDDDNFYWTFLLAIYLLLFGSVFEMYNLQIASNEYAIIKSIVLTVSTTVLLYLLTPILTPPLPSNRIQIVYFFLAILTALLIWRVFYAKYIASHRFEKRVLLVCDSEMVRELIENLTAIDPHYKVIGVLNSGESNGWKEINVKLHEVEGFVLNHKVSEVVVASQDTEKVTLELYDKLLQLLENGYTIREYTQVYENMTKRIPLQYVAQDFYRYFPFSRSNQNRLYLAVTRVMDIMVSLIGVMIGILFIPLLLICNAVGNKGKLFYTQERVGKNGKNFRIIKFRTMVKNAEANGAVFAQTNDNRITPFGKFLRKSRIDEFPQFFNILLGEMSVIGPRPERPVFVKQIAEQMPFYQTRHIIKPGLTGWAQVNYSYGDSIEDSLMKLQYDLYYIKHRSIFLDINIVIKTLSTVLFYRGQ